MGCARPRSYNEQGEEAFMALCREERRFAVLFAKLITHWRQGTLGLRIWWKLGSFLYPFLFFQRVTFRLKVGYWPRLRRPRTFNEKLLWLRLNVRDPRFVALRDKLAVRDFVRAVAPELRIPRVHVVVEDADDIVFSGIPERCVIKANFGGGGAEIAFFDRDRSDPDMIRHQCGQWMGSTYDKRSLAWYKQFIPRRILVEELLVDEHGRIPNDYKVYVFNGHAQYVQVIGDRWASTRTLTWFDRRWNALQFGRPGYRRDPATKVPKRLQDMLEFAERLARSTGHVFVRVDMYCVSGTLYFGEMDFSPGGAMTPFAQSEHDYFLGSQLALPGKGPVGDAS